MDLLDNLYLAIFDLLLTITGKKKLTYELSLPWCWISRTTILVLTFGWLQIRLAISPDGDTTIQILASVVITRRCPLTVRALARWCAQFLAWLAYTDLPQPVPAYAGISRPVAALV